MERSALYNEKGSPKANRLFFFLSHGKKTQEGQTGFIKHSNQLSLSARYQRTRDGAILDDLLRVLLQMPAQCFKYHIKRFC